MVEMRETQAEILFDCFRSWGGVEENAWRQRKTREDGGKGAFTWEGQGSFDSLVGSFARMLPSKKLRVAASLVQTHVEDADGRLKLSRSPGFLSYERFGIRVLCVEQMLG